MFSGDGLYCKLTKALSGGDDLVAILSGTRAAQQSATQTHNPPVKEEPVYPAALPTEIQLLPQQAGMAAILATAVVNSESLLFYSQVNAFLFVYVCSSTLLSSVIRIQAGQIALDLGLQTNKLRQHPFSTLCLPFSHGTTRWQYPFS